MDIPVLSDFPSDQERKLHLSALKMLNPPPYDPYYDPDPVRWGYLERVGRKIYRRTLDFNRGNVGYNIVIDQKTRKPSVVPGTMGNDHHFATNVNTAGRHTAIRIHFPKWDKQHRGWKIYEDGDCVTLGNLQFILHDTSLSEPRPEGAFDKYEDLGLQRAKGSYGSVATVVNRRTAKVCALKIIRDKPVVPGTQRMPTFEISALMALNHLHVCGIEEYFLCSDNTLHIVLEYAPCGNLYEYLDLLDDQYIEPPFSPSETTAAITTQICTAVEFIHSKGITHRDIKLDNALVISHQPFIFIKLADFGIANRTESIVHATHKVICGNFQSIAPEMVNASRYGNAVDAYSVGVIFYRLLLFVCGKTPPQENRKKTLVEDVNRLVEQRRVLWDPPNEFSIVGKEARKLAEGLLKENPSERFSMTDALKNPWLIELGNKNATALQEYQNSVQEDQLDNDQENGMDTDTLFVDPAGDAGKHRVKDYTPVIQRRRSLRLKKIAN